MANQRLVADRGGLAEVAHAHEANAAEAVVLLGLVEPACPHVVCNLVEALRDTQRSTAQETG